MKEIAFIFYAHFPKDVSNTFSFLSQICGLCTCLLNTAEGPWDPSTRDYIHANLGSTTRNRVTLSEVGVLARQFFPPAAINQSQKNLPIFSLVQLFCGELQGTPTEK